MSATSNGADGHSGAPSAVAIEVRGVSKRFRVPEARIDTFKERALHPFSRPEYREIQPLDGVSFDVHRGEFFGIAGRNGSGKSTLLKILSSIYRADSGTVRAAGNIAPFIELGVGFNMEFTARENVILNGVLMGLSRREARRNLDAVLEFAELEDFAEMKLKNYSSGMLVRLAFAVMVQVNADIWLIDEVLAVGDASFAKKCAEVFKELKAGPTTVILVTHDMSSLEEYCDRALLLEDGGIRHIGDPGEVARRYLDAGYREEEAPPDAVTEGARFIRARIETAAGEPVESVEQGSPIHLLVEVEATADVVEPAIGWTITNSAGEVIAGWGTDLAFDKDEEEVLRKGERATLTARVDNVLVPGRYSVEFWMSRNRRFTDIAAAKYDLLHFVVYGADWSPGVVRLPASMNVKRHSPVNR